MCLTDERKVGAKNERHLVAVCASSSAGFEVIHGFLNRIMEVLGVPCSHPCAGEAPSDRFGSYTWEQAPADETSASPFFEGRHGRVLHTTREGRTVPVGDFGVVHPEVLEKFDIIVPVSALEINIEPFCRDQYG